MGDDIIELPFSGWMFPFGRRIILSIFVAVTISP